MSTHADDLVAAIKELRQADRVVVFTGTGVSAESAIPTFRDTGGLWEQFPPEQFAHWQRLIKTATLHPRRFIEFLIAVIEPIANAKPNPAHIAIADLEKHKRTTVITQNIDGLHQEAGSNRVHEIHGSIFCIADSKGDIVRKLNREDLRGIVKELHSARPRMLPLLSLAKALSPLIRIFPPMERPAIVLFGEDMAQPDWTDACVEVEKCQLMLVAGTSGLVWPAASLPDRAKKARAKVIAIDPCRPDYTDVWLEGQAGIVMPQLVHGAVNWSEGK